MYRLFEVSKYAQVQYATKRFIVWSVKFILRQHLRRSSTKHKHGHFLDPFSLLKYLNNNINYNNKTVYFQAYIQYLVQSVLLFLRSRMKSC